MIEVSLDRGPSRSMPDGSTAAQALEALGVSLDRRVVAAGVNGEAVDLSKPLE